MIGVIPVADNPECSEASDGAALDQTNRHCEGVLEFGRTLQCDAYRTRVQRDCFLVVCRDFRIE